MSVRNTKLIMYGVEIQYPHYKSIEGEDEQRSEELDIFYAREPGKVGILSDGMNGGYAVAGTIIARFDDDEMFLSSGPTKLSDLFNTAINKDRQKEVVDQLEKIMGYRPICDYIFINHWH
ncbi:hypothetical protein [Antrihabitans sp. YC2-6]|uniref:hypothetical protein n=1 Tax=Antrihabitans sp. YC2-6 TaxID=2799498 RepID=UPI0018F41619|nr:hypothetical protein [Antrihabitans sp. YC2-6]MBJ8343956.1 hypothetical protein [Antrihabitans sp. YC2-6]